METLSMSAIGAAAEKEGGSVSRPEVELRVFRAEDAMAFRELNEDWIRKNYALETKDFETLGDPEGKILRPGGHIFMALVDGRAVGCCALIPVRPGVFEVAKMTVSESCRGMGIGRKMLAYTIAQGRALGAEALYLESGSKLLAAIHLYESLGFRHLLPERVVPSPYARADVFMELRFEVGC